MKMKTKFQLLLSFILTLGCSQSQKDNQHAESYPSRTIDREIEHLSEWKWMNKPDSFSITDTLLSIHAKHETDFFNNPEDLSVIGTAPFLYQSIEGDFLAKTLVKPDFSSQWNAVALMVHIDSLNWIKFAFENSDATGPSIVSVVTKNTSDDANGVTLSMEKEIWLAIARKDNIYSMHWSHDDENYQMARLTSLPDSTTVRIGIEAQSPVGEYALHQILHMEVNNTTVTNMRDLNQ